MKMKIGILSDSHGWIHPEIISLMNSCDQIIHAGDIIEQQTLEVFTTPLTAVRGSLGLLG
jgi:predicted phosphodiesterase